MRRGVQQCTAVALSEVMTAEAKVVLKSLLEELREDDGDMAEVELGDLIRGVDNTSSAGDSQWIDQLGRDLAMASAAYWLGLGDSQHARTRRLNDIGSSGFTSLASRFYVDDARPLLSELVNPPSATRRTDSVNASTTTIGAADEHATMYERL